MFSVKSYYRKIQGEQIWPQASFWKKVWGLELPRKVIKFMWPVCQLCLPTIVALAMKRVQVDPICAWYLVQNEDATHVLFECPFAR